MVMGDWTPGVLWSKGFNDFGWGTARTTGDLLHALRLLRPAEGRQEPRRRRQLAEGLRLEARPGRLQLLQGLDPGPNRRRHQPVHRLPQVGAEGLDRPRPRSSRASSTARPRPTRSTSPSRPPSTSWRRRRTSPGAGGLLKAAKDAKYKVIALARGRPSRPLSDARTARLAMLRRRAGGEKWILADEYANHE